MSANPYLLFLFGCAIGVMSGLLGIGGGVLLVPGLMLLFGFTQPEAQGTSLAVMIPPIGLVAAMVYYKNGDIQLPVVGLVALGIALGAFFGATFVSFLPIHILRVTFGCLLLYLGFLMVLSSGSGKTSAALPAAVAALVSWSFLIVWRRFRKPLPPSDDIDYHI